MSREECQRVLRVALAYLGLTQREFAERSGLTDSSVHRILKAPHSITDMTAKLFAQGLERAGLDGEQLEAAKAAVTWMVSTRGQLGPTMDKFHARFKACNGNLPPAVRDWLEGRA